MAEISKMKDFQHPNVMSLIGVCLDAGPGVSIVMPFMANGSLLDYLKKERDNLYLSETNEIDEVAKSTYCIAWLISGYSSMYWTVSQTNLVLLNWFQGYSYPNLVYCSLKCVRLCRLLRFTFIMMNAYTFTSGIVSKEAFAENVSPDFQRDGVPCSTEVCTSWSCSKELHVTLRF